MREVLYCDECGARLNLYVVGVRRAGRMNRDAHVAASPRYYQAIIKINPTDTPERQASDIADGIGYACALLLDEHGWSAERVADLLERVTDEVADSEAQRGV